MSMNRRFGVGDFVVFKWHNDDIRLGENVVNESLSLLVYKPMYCSNENNMIVYRCDTLSQHRELADDCYPVQLEWLHGSGHMAYSTLHNLTQHYEALREAELHTSEIELDDDPIDLSSYEVFAPVKLPSTYDGILDFDLELRNMSPIDLADSIPIYTQGTAANPIFIADSGDDEPIDIVSETPLVSEFEKLRNAPAVSPRKKQKNTATAHKSSTSSSVAQHLNEALICSVNLQLQDATTTKSRSKTKQKERGSCIQSKPEKKKKACNGYLAINTVSSSLMTIPQPSSSQAGVPTTPSHTPRNDAFGKNVIQSSQSLHQKYKLRDKATSDSSDYSADAKCGTERLRESPKKMLQGERPALMSAKMERNQTKSKSISSAATESLMISAAKVPIKALKEVEYLPEIISETSCDSTSTTSPITTEHLAKHRGLRGSLSSRRSVDSPPAVIANNKRKNHDERIEVNQAKVQTPYPGVVACGGRYIAFIRSRNADEVAVPGIFDTALEAAVARDEMLRRNSIIAKNISRQFELRDTRYFAFGDKEVNNIKKIKGHDVRSVERSGSLKHDSTDDFANSTMRVFIKRSEWYDELL